MTFTWDNPERAAAEIARMLNARSAGIQRIPERALRRGTFELLKLVQELIAARKTTRGTSTLVRSVTAVVERIGADLMEGRVGSHASYALYFEQGTGLFGPRKKAFIVTAKRGGGLFWGVYNGKGKAVVRRSVTIKGMKPRTPFGSAVEQFLPRFVEIIKQETEREAA